MTDKLGLHGDDYWKRPTSTLIAVFEWLSREQFNGAWIGAPDHVSLDAQQTLPIVAYRGGSYFDARYLRFSTHAILAAVDLERNVVRFANAVAVDPAAALPTGDHRPILEGYTAVPYVVDARNRLALPWRPATFLFSIIMRDRVSNRARVCLGKSFQGFRDEAVDEFIALYRKRQGPGPVQPAAGNPLPCYDRLPESPEIPAQNGIAVNVARVLLLDKDTRWILHGTFRLPVLSREIVRISEHSETQPTPTAIPRITLLAVAAASGRWTTIELCVPSYDPIDPAMDHPVVTGYFSLDLMRAVARPAGGPQTYFLYIFSGEILEGPVASALVPESSLAPVRYGCVYSGRRICPKFIVSGDS
jgi:hypothetical protein